jgi:hypothetical protein
MPNNKRQFNAKRSLKSFGKNRRGNKEEKQEPGIALLCYGMTIGISKSPVLQFGQGNENIKLPVVCRQFLPLNGVPIKSFSMAFFSELDL